MKNNIFNAILMLIMISLTTSCDRREIFQNTINEEDVVEIVEMALSTGTEGLTMQVQDAAEMTLTTVSLPCNTIQDSTIVKTNQPGSLRTYQYTFDWNWQLYCNAVIPEKIDFNYTANGNYNTPRLSSNDEASFDFDIIGIAPTESSLVYNGNYTRKGTQVSKVRNQLEFNTTLLFTTTDLSFSKSTKKIEGGTITFSFTGDVAEGDSSNYEGTITFQGNETATISMNGETYLIDL